MPDPITLTPGALLVFGGIGTILCSTIGYLERQMVAQLKARAERAERQVDTLLPAVTQLTSSVERLGDKL